MATIAARAITPAPPANIRAASPAPESNVGIEEGAPLLTVPLPAAGVDAVPFPKTGATGAVVMVLVATDGDVVVVISTLLVDEAVLLAYPGCWETVSEAATAVVESVTAD